MTTRPNGEGAKQGPTSTRKRSPATRPTKEAQAAPTAQRATAARTATVNLPFVTAEFRMPDVHVPEVHVPRPRVPSMHMPTVHVPRPPVPHVSRREVSDVARFAASHLPSRKRLGFFASLGALAALDVIDWPVAAVVAAGSAIRDRQATEPRSPRAARAAAPPASAS